MPKAPDPTMRAALVEAAAQLVAEDGRDALTTRRLAAEVGTSTMSIYTYFSGMNDLLVAIRAEGFRRFAELLAHVEPDESDPLAELGELGTAYFVNAVTNPHFYRFAFMGSPVDPDLEVGLGTFQRLIDGVGRAISAGAFRGEPEERATQLWAAGHGAVSLHLAGMLELEAAIACFRAMSIALMVANGADPEGALRSLEKGAARFVLEAGVPYPYQPAAGVPATSR